MHPRSATRVRRAGGLLAAGYAATWLTNRSLRRVSGESMLPSLRAGDLLVTVPASRSRLRRGDVVIARTPAGAVTKRLIGLPGEDVLLQDGHLHVDGVWFDEPYALPVDEEMRWHPGPDEVVLLGDNRAHSTDSRQHGCLAVTSIERLAVARVRPWGSLRGQGPVPRHGPRRRHTVRIVVLDPDDRVLLFHVRDVDGTDATWWETPGGGMHLGEDPVTAARRELEEETGHRDVPIVPLDRVVERPTSARGAQLVKVETLLAARLPSADVDRSGWTDAEVRNTLDLCWFSTDELAELDEPTAPGDIGALVPVAGRLLADHGRRQITNSSGSSSATESES